MSNGNGDDRAPERGVVYLKVGAYLASAPHRKHWTQDVSKHTGINRGSVHRVLRQFQADEWVNSTTGPGQKKTTRILYGLTEFGICALNQVLAPFQISNPLST